MKRILLTILAVFYLGISSGATVHFHYCMGKLISWSINEQRKDICDFCGMLKGKSKANSCCQDEKQQAKVEKSQKASQTVYQFDPPSSAILQPALLYSYNTQIPVKMTREALSNAPPEGQLIPVFLRNCTFRI